MSNSTKIDPALLKAMRNKRHLNQKELAEKIGVDVGTISRWERGKSTIRASTMRKLKSALNATDEELCDKGPLPDEQPARAEPRNEQMNLIIDTACRNAMALIAKRYRVSRQQIVEAAPLLFYIAAEESLRKRRRYLDDLEAYLQFAAEAAQPHLPVEILQCAEGEAALEAERQSVEERDIFGARIAKEVGFAQGDEGEINPFAKFLSKRLNNVSKTKDPHTVYWDLEDSPRYAIGRNEALALVGGDEEAAALILKGLVALHEMPGEIRRSTPEKKAAWVRDEIQKIRNSDSLLALPELKTFVDELDADFDKQAEEDRLRYDPATLQNEV